MLRYTIFISSVNILSSLQTIYFLPDIWPALSKIRQYSPLFFNTLSFVCDTDYFKNEIIFNKENSCIFPISIVSLRYGEIFGYTIFIIPSAHFLYFVPKLFTFSPTSILHFLKFDNTLYYLLVHIIHFMHFKLS